MSIPLFICFILLSPNSMTVSVDASAQTIWNKQTTTNPIIYPMTNQQCVVQYIIHESIHEIMTQKILISRHPNKVALAEEAMHVYLVG